MKIKEKAIEELKGEYEREALKEYKEKVRELDKAKQIVKNVERELVDLEEKIEQKYADIQ
jgi:hypothetical protein